MAPETEGLKGSFNIGDQQEAKFGLNIIAAKSSTISRDSKGDGAGSGTIDTETFATKFSDERWKNGTWDLNMFVREGNMDWDAVIVAGIYIYKFIYDSLFNVQSIYNIYSIYGN